MENTRGHEFPCFLSQENDLEAVQEEYFNPRLAEEEVDEDEDFSDDSSDDETGSILTSSFWNWTRLLDRKWRLLWMCPW